MDDAPDNEPANAQVAQAEKALAVKQAGASEPDHPKTGDHADEGLRSIPFEDQPPSGALDAEGQRPVLERSRKVH